MCIRVPKVLILGVGGLESMSSNLFAKTPSTCNFWFVEAYIRRVNIVVASDLCG
jgi:hypothetical protein